MIGIVDYGLGNIRAFENIYKLLGKKIKIIRNPHDFNSVEKLILPGVGSFDWALEKLEQSGLKDNLIKNVQDKKKPILGICVGMQIMATFSEEGKRRGLNWIPGNVRRFELSDPKLTPIPQIGWNKVSMNKNLIAKGLKNSKFYFLHSYYYSPENSDYIFAKTEYDSEFASGINKENIFGVQFHPEKSHDDGIRLLKNFSEI